MGRAYAVSLATVTAMRRISLISGSVSEVAPAFQGVTPTEVRCGRLGRLSEQDSRLKRADS
jgi:hypothetical protein